MKILITGATGFAGAWILKILSDKYGSSRVCGTGRNLERAQALRDEGYQLITGDLTDTQFVQDNLQGYTHIVHCAALSSPFGDYQTFYLNNVQATLNVLNGIRSAEKIVYISTPSLYFNFTDRLNVKESDPLPQHFVNHYASTKYLAEQAVLKHPGLKSVVLRPRAIIGAGDTVILPRLLRAYETGRLKIIGGGQNQVEFTSVKNLAHAVDLALNSGEEAHSKVFNITDGEPRLLWPFIEQTLGKMGCHRKLTKVPYPLAYAMATLQEWYANNISKKEPVLTRFGVGTLRYSLTLDISAAREILGYQPVITTDQTIDTFVQHYLGSPLDVGQL
jgi:nucleoside-diphosphate-sugar epimerase